MAVLTAVSVLFAAGCSHVDDIRLTSCEVKHVKLDGSRSVEGVLEIGVDNPVRGFDVSDFSGSLKYRGREIGRFSADDIAIASKSSQKYELPCRFTLDENVSVIEVMAIAVKGSLEGVTADIDMKVKRGLFSKTLHFKDLDIKKINGK